MCLVLRPLTATARMKLNTKPNYNNNDSKVGWWYCLLFYLSCYCCVCHAVCHAVCYDICHAVYYDVMLFVMLCVMMCVMLCVIMCYDVCYLLCCMCVIISVMLCVMLCVMCYVVLCCVFIMCVMIIAGRKNNDKCQILFYLQNFTLCCSCVVSNDYSHIIINLFLHFSSSLYLI